MFKVRTCPSCGHKIGIKHYLKKHFTTTVFSTILCEGCESELRLSKGRRVLIALFVGLLLFLFEYLVMFIEGSRNDIGFWKYVIYALYFVLGLSLSFLDSFKLKEK
ncbi:MAG: hypothetical protein H6584_06460 [Flavobacteriales bacterium]|nr:hypothetical protein [Flavobacteriales bacterium]